VSCYRRQSSYVDEHLREPVGTEAGQEHDREEEEVGEYESIAQISAFVSCLCQCGGIVHDDIREEEQCREDNQHSREEPNGGDGNATADRQVHSGQALGRSIDLGIIRHEIPFSKIPDYLARSIIQ